MAIHVNDVGIVIRVTVMEKGAPLDISTATGLELRFRQPITTGTVVTRTATFVTDGSDGQLQYALEPGDITEIGVWEVRPHFSLGTFTGHTKAVTFTVWRVR